MPNQLMGFEGILYHGTAGSTATTQMTNVRDIPTLSYEPTKGNTTVRGDSSAPPIHTEDVTKVTHQLEFTMLNDTTDAIVELLKAATTNGTAYAIRGKDYASGKGPDADYTFAMSNPWMLEGEQVITFTATPTRGYGRAPQLYV